MSREIDPNGGTTRITATVGLSDEAWLKKESKRVRRSMSELVREAIAHYRGFLRRRRSRKRS